MTGRTNNPCTECGLPGIPGLVAGAGKCQYHWNVGQYGQAWADTARDHFLYEEYAGQMRAYNFTAMTRQEWAASDRAARARQHYAATGHAPGQYIGPQETP